VTLRLFLYFRALPAPYYLDHESRSSKAGQPCLSPCNPVRGPNYHGADLALIKHTTLRERTELEFRTEIFHLTNTPAFGQPNGVLGTSAFGTITSTASDPRVVQFGLKVNF